MNSTTGQPKTQCLRQFCWVAKA